MKTMTCRQLGGACDKEFSADTFEKIAEMSKEHGTEMFQKSDGPHLAAMKEIQDLMKTPEDMAKWFEEMREEFNSLPEED